MNEQERDGTMTTPEEVERAFSTDQPSIAMDEQPAREQVLEETPDGAAVMAPERKPLPDLSYLDLRPTAAAPREYHFPRFERSRLGNGMELLTADLPGRPLLTAQLLIRGNAGGGAANEPAGLGGVTVLMARALSEGTRQRDALGLIEASERLGAELSADTAWDSVAAGVDVPRSRLEPALALLAEMALEPSFPAGEVARLRDQRINDLKQAKADPGRRIERLFPERIYEPSAPYVRPLAGTETTVEHLDRDAVAARHQQLMRAGAASLLVVGDLAGIDVPKLAERTFAAWPNSEPAASTPPPQIAARRGQPRVLLVDRPGAPQSEVRVGHVGLPRKVPDFHAIAVLNSILGASFNSRLNRLLREERGYTYGVHSSFDFRRGPGPFVVRTAVHTEVTAAAVRDIVDVLERMRTDAPTDAELQLARDYLVGVFPLRFETAGQVTAALGGIVVFELPDDELDRYRPAMAAVTREDVVAAAERHIRPDEASIVVVGDASQFEAEMRSAGLGEVEVVRERQEGNGKG